MWLWRATTAASACESRPPNSLPLSESTRSAASRLAGARWRRAGKCEVCSTVGDPAATGSGRARSRRTRSPTPIAVICQTGPSTVQAADEEAVDTDQLARPVGVDVWLWLRLARRFIGGPIAGHEPSRLARVSRRGAQTTPDAVWADLQPAPFGARERARPARPEPGMAEREGDDPLLDRGESGFGICGRRRSRGRSISSPDDRLGAPAVVGTAMTPKIRQA